MRQQSTSKWAAEVELGSRPLIVWGYAKTGNLICRVEINRSGIAVYSGKKATKALGEMSWEGLVRQLSKS